MSPAAVPSTSAKVSSALALARRAEDDEVRPYVIVSDLGKGSFATVYKGYHEETRREVAIKTVSRSGLSSKLFENLQSEIEILKSLSHRHVTRLIDIVRAERNIYLIMEYCAGGDLTNYIKKRGRVENLQYVPEPGAAPQWYPHPRTGGLAETVVRSFLRQLARALKFLRQRDLIHRDIKPQNLLLTPAPPSELARGHPLGVPLLKVADFGFARFLPTAMMAETLCGSPLYMAPEILSYKPYDAKADLWSVGAVLYEMAVGRPPFRAQNHIELLKKIEVAKAIKFPDEEPPKAGVKEEDRPVPVPDDIKALIRALLRRVPAERADYDAFFKSPALANSKFPRPAPVEPQASQQDGRERTRTQSSSNGNVNGKDEGARVESRVPGEILERHLDIPPEVLDPNTLIPPSKFRFRRRASNAQEDLAPPPPPPALELPRRPRKVSEGEVIPGETEEDGLLRREYVLVGDTRALEFNKAVDEITAARRRPGPLVDRHGAPAPTPLALAHSPPDPDYFAASPTAGAPAPNAIRSRPPSTSAAPNSTTPIRIPDPTPGPSSSPPTFPPPPNPQRASPGTLARSPSNALSRALNLASKKLFGAVPSSPTSGSPLAAGTPGIGRDRRDSGSSAGGVNGFANGVNGASAEGDPVEDELLAALEQLAQKTDVITRWADELYALVKAVPQKPLPNPKDFAPRPHESEKDALKRQRADAQAEYNAVTCVAIYMLVMSFSQKGIDELRRYQSHMEMRHPAEGDGADDGFELSAGFDDALGWFREHFLTCNDRVALVKTWLPASYAGPRSWVDELVYNRALALSRAAARKELMDSAAAPDECARLYEDSLWCLYALQDDLLQRGNPFMDEDRATIATWIKRTKLRLVRCKERMGMRREERMRDVQADRNLDDVVRTPAPWDVEGLMALKKQGGGA